MPAHPAPGAELRSPSTPRTRACSPPLHSASELGDDRYERRDAIVGAGVTRSARRGARVPTFSASGLDCFLLRSSRSAHPVDDPGLGGVYPVANESVWGEDEHGQTARV